MSQVKCGPHPKGVAEGKGAGPEAPGPRPPGEADGENEVTSEFKGPLNALVQNCTILHNIVGPACIFLRQGFAKSQLVCTMKN